MKIFYKWFFSVGFLLLGLQAIAQQSAVQVTTQFIPPYSLNISDYATSAEEKLYVQLLLTDITEVNRSVRLRMYIESDDFTIKTIDFPTGETPIYLDGGFPVQLSNLDLGYLFKLENLQGIDPDAYNKTLPEGLYQFCFEVYDAITNVRISQKSCMPLYLVQNDPPILNLPSKGEIVAQKDIQNVIFQWTPRHLNATNVEYEFTLKELWDTYANPQAAFLSSTILYQTTSFAPTLLYGPGEPELWANKRYAWQVRAISRSGISENAVFKNNGYSEIFYFTYSADCNVPQFLLTEAQSITKVKVMWQAEADQTQFNVQYRKKGVKDAVWFERPVQNDQEANLYNLQPDTWYEFRVGSSCIIDFTSNEPLYSYSDIAEFKTPKKGENSSYNCGYVPKIEITNNEPIENLGVNEVFTAGDFPVTITEINSSPGGGGWVGAGYIVVPYLADTKLKVAFTNIKINTDLQLIQGVVLTTYDPTWSGVDGVQDEIDVAMDAIGDLSSIIEQLLNLDLSRTTRANINAMLDAMTSKIDIENLPEEIKQPLVEAQNAVETASNNYYDAQDSYNNATSDAEKNTATKDMDKAEDEMKDAKKDLGKAEEKFEKYIKEVQSLLKKALVELYREGKKLEPTTYLTLKNAYNTTIVEPEGLIYISTEIETDLPQNSFVIEAKKVLEAEKIYALIRFAYILSNDNTKESTFNGFLENAKKYSHNLMETIRVSKEQNLSDQEIITKLKEELTIVFTKILEAS